MDYKPNKLYWHEALDRSHVACDHFHEYVENHPAITNDKDLKLAAERVTDHLQKFYQLVGMKSYEFDKKNDRQMYYACPKCGDHYKIKHGGCYSCDYND